MKIQKKMSMAESTRQVLNRSIDLLHKLSNRKIVLEGAKKELSVVLSQYFISLYPNPRGIDESLKIKLELFLDQAYDILIKVDSGKTPLYEAIMLMNKVVMQSHPSDSEEVKLFEKEEEDPGFVSQEFDLSGDKPEKTRIVAPQESEKVDWFFKEPKEEEKPKPVFSEPPRKGASDLLQEVIRQKEALDLSIRHLNVAVREIGFEFRRIE